VLLAHPAIAQAAVFAIPHSTLGEDIAAAVVLRAHMTAAEDELREFAAQRLADFRVPRRVLIVPDIPTSATGKLQRSTLADAFGPLLKSQFALPSGPLELALAGIWADVLSLPQVGTRDNFFMLGGHSLLAARLVAKIEKALGKEVPLAALFQAPTVEDLARLLGREAALASESLMVSFQPGGSKPPIFCIRCPGDFVRYLALHLGPDQPCYALAPHGFNGRRAPSTVEQMAAEYLAEIRSLQPAGPYFLAGYSFGGLVAFEAAQQLQKQGQEIALLALLDPTGLMWGQAPPVSGPEAVTLRNARARSDVNRHWDQLRRLKPSGKLAYVWARIKVRVNRRFENMIGRRLKNAACAVYLRTEGRVPPILRRFYFLEAGRRAAQAYVPQVYPGRAILFFAEKPSFNLQESWGRLVVGGVEMHGVAADHAEMLGEPHIHVLTERLSAHLRAAQETSGGPAGPPVT
jgi:aspartate racemase